MEGEERKKIRLYYTHGKIFVWDHKDVITLRKEHRIVGNLVGSLPRAPRQNIHLGLPLQLAFYEAKLLVDTGVGEIVISKNLEKYVDEKKVQQFKELRQKSYEDQIPLFKDARRKEIQQHKHLIIEGKKTKKRKHEELRQVELQNKSKESNAALQTAENFESQNDLKIDQAIPDKIQTSMKDDDKDTERDSSSLNNEEEDKEEEEEDFDIDQIDIPDIKPEHAIVQLFTESLWNIESTEPYQDWRYPQTDAEGLQYHVFKDLWQQNYFITPGNKFGGDFLVYPGDPALFHSFYIAVCLPHDETLTSLEIVTLGRLGANVRKTVLMCSMSGDKVLYTSLQWTGIT
ncbi:hypothetical protein LOTGIDRAFT_236781 [Lottia gigantea]|uniref:tRNA-splicing endonuclease subunit Sen34 n=1 Tax=Lottia gigantea TaxID=225164 RepID=V3ZL99_LOTGI|nr:hypothetical protein LOTGIDRAFT_236781 [Lottia gigantea]ESO83185.1 hypothetical protein LOTGIDRAFT_236781 [Lottia gigantea]